MNWSKSPESSRMNEWMHYHPLIFIQPLFTILRLLRLFAAIPLQS
jgi:hypothetical protein